MRTVNAAVLAVSLPLVACAGPDAPLRTGVVPLGPKDEVEVKRDEGKRSAADKTPPVIGAVPAATEAGEPRAEVTWRTVTQIVEVPAAAPAPAPTATWSSGSDVPEYAPAGGYPYYPVPVYERRERESWFPYGTAIGIGIGSALDHHHGHHGHHHHHGAWVGGTLGLMFDLARWR
jgi:hypothetical protein